MSAGLVTVARTTTATAEGTLLYQAPWLKSGRDREACLSWQRGMQADIA